jgi:hypothetical protein
MIRSLFKKSRPITLGRWARNSEARKAELANHDHCGGPQCSKTELTKAYDNARDFTSDVTCINDKDRNTDVTRM